MPEYRLPDNRTLQVPDDTPPEEWQKIQNSLAELYPDHYQPYEPDPERSVLGGLAQAPQALPRGWLNTVLLSAIGYAETGDYGEDTKFTADLKNLKAYLNGDPSADAEQARITKNSLLTKFAPPIGLPSKLADYALDKFGFEDRKSALDPTILDPEGAYRGSLYQSVPEGLGSAAAFIGTTALNPWAGGALAIGTGVGTQAELQDQARARGEEISLSQEIKSKILGGVIGWSEVLNPLSILKIFRGVPKGDPRPIVQHIKNSVKSAGIEGTQEMLAGYFQELVAQGIYDPTLEVGESMADDFTVGAIVGAIVGGGSSAAHHQIHKNQGNDHALSQANEYDKQEQEQDEITRQKVILAEQQGDQIIDPALVPDPFVGPVPDEVKPEGVEIPVLESFDFVPNDDGSVNVIGKETQQSIGTFSNIEEAARAATEKTKQNRNQFVVGSAEQITGINGLAGNGTASNIARKLYNPLNTLIDAKVLANFDVRVSNKRQQQFKKEQEIAKNEEAGQRKLASELMGNIDTTGLSIEELGQMQQELARELSNIQTAYPIEGNVVAPESTLGLFWEYAEKSGIGAKNFYTVKEAKKLLNKADFNQLMSEKSNIKFKKIEATGEIKPVKRIKDRLDISKKSFDDAFKSKNIEVDFKSPAFKYLAETFTGDTNLDSMGKGQKEMLLSHIKSLPRFNNKTKLPDYTPRPYTEEQINAFYNQYKGSQFTNKDIKLGVKNNATGKDLTPKQINQLRIDLLDSGRAKKDKNRLRMTDDFTLQQARKAESYTNETTDEFRNRLRRTTLLTTEEIDAAVNDDAIYKQGVIDANDVLALPSPEPIEKYSNLFKLIQQRLVDRNLGDIGVAFNNKLKPSLNIRQKGDKYFYEPVDLDKSKGKPTAVYDRPLKKIIASLEAIDPDGTMSESELATALVNIMDHETYHALIQLGIIKQSEHDIMFKDAKKLLPIDFQKELVKRYRGVKLDAKGKEKEISNADLKKELGPDLEEEFAAEFLRISINNPSKLISPKSKTIINKIINFLTTLGQTIYDAGFTSSRTIIRDIESGKIGARERGQIRNFQQVRKRNLKKYGIARPDASQLDIDRLSKYADIPSFSRQERETLQKEINKLSNQINQKNRRYDLDYAYIGNKTARNDLNEIAFLEKKRDIAKEKLRSLNPVPLDYPSFSRIQPIQLDKVTSTRITARVEDQEIELHYAGKDKVFKEHRVDENTGEGYFNWNVYVKPISRNSPMRESIRWLLQSVKVRGYENQKTGKKKKWKKTDSLQDVADFLNKENGDTENDSGYLSIDDDLVGDITIKEDKDQRNVYTGLLNIELEDRAKGKGIGQAVVEMVASTNPAIVNGEKQLEIYDITPQGRPFWEAIGTEFNRDRIKKASIKLSYLDGKIGFAKDQPSFSRASTDTSPAYMDFSREQIAEESTMDVHFYPNYPTEVPLTWVARINIDDFLYMTTSNDAEIQEIAEEGVMTVSEAVQIMEQGLPVKRKRVQPKFDPEIFDEGTIGLLPRLSIDQNGKVTSHEGRHRIALAKKEGAITTPVFFKMRRNDMRNLLRGEFFKDKNLSNAALQDLGIYNLKSQFRESAVQRGVLDISGLITAPVVRGDTQTMETLRQTQLDFATQVAQGPDVKAPTNNPPINLPQDQPSFSRANISKRFEPYDGDIPTFSRAQLKSKPILFKDKIIMEEGDVSNISEFARRSRTYDKKLKTIPLDLVNKYPKLRELSLKNLRKFLNKNGNLVVYRSLNLSENEEIINNGQLPNDPFASTTLDSKYAQTLGKDIAVQNIFQIKLVNKLYKDKKISESDYKILTRQSLDMFDNMDKEVVINKLRNQGIELVKKFERPINVLRYEIPLDRVILHMPIVPEAIRNDFTEVADYENSQGGGDIRPEYDDYVQDGMTEEQIEDAEVEYEDDLSSYESEINALTEQIEDGFLNMEEESEVIANLDGITPTYIYKPSSSELEFQDSSRKGKRYAKDIPSFSRAGLNPRDLIYIDGVIEEQVYKVWRDNNMNPTAKDLRELFKILAPQSKRKHKFVDFAQLKREVRRAAKKGYEINWYAAWAANVPHIVGPSNMHEFSGVFGITSAQQTPEKNFKDTLRTMIIARKHSPELHPKKFRSELLRAGVSMGNKRRIDAIEDFYKVGIFERKGSSQKTITYALEILAQSKGEFTPFMVIDRHILKKFGLDENLEKATEIEYRMLQTLNALLSAENYVIDGQVRKFNPPEIQALLWADQRYTGPTASQITNEGNYQAAEKYAEQEVSEIDKMQEEGTFNKNNSFAGHFIQRPRYSSNKQSDIFDTDLGQTMYQSFVNLSPQIIIEFKSGRKRGYLPDKLSQPISFDRWNKFQNDQLKAITSGNKLKLALKLGIPHTISRSAGTWDGTVNPNTIIHLPNVDSNTIKNLTAVLLDALMQDSAVIAIPTGRGVRKTQMIITKPQNARFNLNELQDVLNRLSQVERIVKYADGDKKEPLNFTVSATKKSGIIIIDPKQFSGDPYTREDQREFVNLVQPVLTTSGYKLEKYGQESELIEYGEDSSNSTGTRGRIRELGSQVGFIGSSDLQRTAIRDLYQPLYKEYKKLANEIGFIPKSIPPYLEENSALNGLLDFNVKDIAETEAELESYLDSLPPSRMSRWNPAANPISLRIAFDYQEGIEPIAITDAPSYSRSEKIIPEKYKDIDETINGDNNTPDETFADAIIDIAETTEEVGSFLSRMRAHIIDDMSIPEKTLIKLGKASAKIRELNSRAITGAIQMLRWSKKSRGIMSQMMLRGVPVLVDEQGNPVPKGTKGFGGTKVLDFKHGGFVKIMGQLHTTEYGEDLMRLFKMYRIGLRGTRLDAEGKEVVLTPEQLKLAKEIGQDFPIIKMVSDQYNEYNNAILDYAVQTGILSEEITINQLIKNITTSTKIKENELRKKQIEAEKNGLTDEQFLEQLLDLAAEQNINLPVGKKIETRGTAQIWKENADYYPFYRKMADDTIQGPSVAGGFLSGNPLKIEIKGSKRAIEPEPLEVMARNMQSIVTAAMKNEGLSRLMAIYEEGGIAKKILLKDKKEAKDLGSDVIDVFENGETVHYQVADPIFTYGLQALGMTQDASAFMKVIGLPANVLRESITREPGFIIKNMLRDTLSASVTSGADYIPIIDTFKGFAADLSELERFGIIGGYDAANDRQDIVKKINKIKREQGLDVYDQDGNFAIEQVVKFWDLMGGLTTSSDGSTRKAVADSILELTGDQVEAAYQGLEIINFDRRGFSPFVRIVTTAIPFLNARFQGIDVLYRSATGQYSSKISEIARDSTPEETAKSIILTHAFRGGLLMLLTGLYYALMGDDEKYKEERQSVRDDNWLIPIYKDLPSFKFPVPFEVGFMYKTVPERILDYSMTKLENPNYGNTTGKQLEESIRRGFTTTLKLDPIAWQLWKPIMEVRANKSGFTGNPIVPPFMEKGLDPQEQYNINTSSFAVGFGKAFNVSPIKVDYILKGYTGTLGTYVLDMSDIAVRQATGREYVAPHLTQLPIVKSLFASPVSGGLQEQYYEMRTYSNRVIQTINDLEKKGRKDELVAYMQSHKGAISTRDEVLRIDRFMEEYRKTKMLVQLNETLSPKEKKEIIEQLDRSRNLRLAIVPLLVKRTDQPTYLTGVIRN